MRSACSATHPPLEAPFGYLNDPQGVVVFVHPFDVHCCYPAENVHALLIRQCVEREQFARLAGNDQIVRFHTLSPSSE